MMKNLNNLDKLNFNFEYKNRLIRSIFDDKEYFKFDTPFLKVLKPIHISTNKKKNIEKKYIILEVNENYNVNNELDEFIILINKLHEISQENIKKNSIKWFNTEFDEIGLDMKVKKPIDRQKDKQFIKIIIPNDNNELLEKITKIEKDSYVSTTIFYKGLKVSNDHLMGEYELIDITTQEEYENLIKKESIQEDNLIEFQEDNIVKEKFLEEDIVENIIEDNCINEDNNIIEDNSVIEDNSDKELNNHEDDLKEVKTNVIKAKTIENNLPKSKKNEKAKNNNPRFIKLVTRKNKSLIFI